MNSVEQRKVIAKFAVVIVAVLLILLCYSYFLPRTEVEIDTVYHRSYSGLFVQSKVSNAGTKEITDLKVKRSVAATLGCPYEPARTTAELKEDLILVGSSKLSP